MSQMTPEQALTFLNNVVLYQTGRDPDDVSKPKMMREAPSIPARMHPLTCGNNSNHLLFPVYCSSPGKVFLVCAECDYTQDSEWVADLFVDKMG